MADWQTQIVAAFRMGRRTPEGTGRPLCYRRTGNDPEWLWTDSEVYQSLDRFDPELLRPYGAHLHDPEAGNWLLRPVE